MQRWRCWSIYIFDTYEDTKNFIMNEMLGRGGTYYFGKSKMDCKKNVFILFQYKGKLIGYAIYENTTILDEPYRSGDMEYYRLYTFKSRSLHLLNKPITTEQFSSMDKRFNQIYQRIMLRLLLIIIQFIRQNGGTKKYELNKDYVISLLEEIRKMVKKTNQKGCEKLVRNQII